MPITITDLAKRLGVSHTLVSHALRGTGRMAPATRERIQVMAKELGYRPNPAAQAVRSGRRGVVTLIQDELRGLLSPLLLEGLFETLERHHLRLAFARIAHEELARPNLLDRLGCDGVLVNLGGSTEDMRLAPGVPGVWINHPAPHLSVRPEEEGTFAEAVRRLADLGHRQIGYCDFNLGRDGMHFSHDHRSAGYRRACAELGLEPSFCVLTSEERRARQLRPTVAAWLERHPQVTALLCYSQREGVVAVCAALRLGRDLPGDLSVVAAGDMQRRDDLPLAMLVQPWAEIGRLAAEMLVARLKDPAGAEPPSRTVPYQPLTGEQHLAPPRKQP